MEKILTSPIGKQLLLEAEQIKENYDRLQSKIDHLYFKRNRTLITSGIELVFLVFIYDLFKSLYSQSSLSNSSFICFGILLLFRRIYEYFIISKNLKKLSKELQYEKKIMSDIVELLRELGIHCVNDSEALDKIYLDILKKRLARFPI